MTCMTRKSDRVADITHRFIHVQNMQWRVNYWQILHIKNT